MHLNYCISVLFLKPVGKKRKSILGQAVSAGLVHLHANWLVQIKSAIIFFCVPMNSTSETLKKHP